MLIQCRRRRHMKFRLAIKAVGRADCLGIAHLGVAGLDCQLQMQRLRVLERLIGIVGRRMRHLESQQLGAPGIASVSLEDRREDLDQVILMLDPVQPLGKARVFGQLAFQ
jgi:hypothetical protein